MQKLNSFEVFDRWGSEFADQSLLIQEIIKDVREKELWWKSMGKRWRSFCLSGFRALSALKKLCD
jgi:hypothetical protein